MQHAAPQQPTVGRTPSRSDEIIDLIDRCLADLESGAASASPRPRLRA
jgi:hypothetical protein